MLDVYTDPIMIFVGFGVYDVTICRKLLEKMHPEDSHQTQHNHDVLWEWCALIKILMAKVSSGWWHCKSYKMLHPWMHELQSNAIRVWKRQCITRHSDRNTRKGTKDERCATLCSFTPLQSSAFFLWRKF